MIRAIISADALRFYPQHYDASIAALEKTRISESNPEVIEAINEALTATQKHLTAFQRTGSGGDAYFVIDAPSRHCQSLNFPRSP